MTYGELIVFLILLAFGIGMLWIGITAALDNHRTLGCCVIAGAILCAYAILSIVCKLNPEFVEWLGGLWGTFTNFLDTPVGS